MKQRWQSKIAANIATLGPVGYLPMPGTMGTLCALPLLYALRYAMVRFNFFNERFILLVLFFITLWVVDRALDSMRDNDPSEIVLDEVLGYFVVMMGMPMNPLVLLLAFAYFRFFDIVKPLGIERIEKVTGAWGVVLDDVVAAVFAHILLGMTLRLFYI